MNEIHIHRFGSAYFQFSDVPTPQTKAISTTKKDLQIEFLP